VVNRLRSNLRCSNSWASTNRPVICVGPAHGGNRRGRWALEIRVDVDIRVETDGRENAPGDRIEKGLGLVPIFAIGDQP
jgi:hypothetical protein